MKLTQFTFNVLVDFTHSSRSHYDCVEKLSDCLDADKKNPTANPRLESKIILAHNFLISFTCAWQSSDAIVWTTLPR